MPISLQDVYLRPGFLLKRCHQVTAAIFAEHCREFGVTPSRGLLEREVNEQDARRMRLRLSPAGRRLLAQMEPVAKRAQEAALSVLPREKRAPFIELLNDFLRGHGAVIEPADVMSGKPFGSEFDALISTRPGKARADAAKRRPRKRTLTP
jgi:hypothetical protein